MVATTAKTNIGKITQIIGPVVDVQFPTGKMPQIYNALRIEGKNEAGQDVAVTCEVQQLLGDNQVRAVSMSSTDGLVRGMEAVDTGAAIPPELLGTWTGTSESITEPRESSTFSKEAILSAAAHSASS